MRTSKPDAVVKRQSPIMISAPCHEYLIRLASDRTALGGGKISLRSLIEDALHSFYPDMPYADAPGKRGPKSAAEKVEEREQTTRELQAMAGIIPSKPAQSMEGRDAGRTVARILDTAAKRDTEIASPERIATVVAGLLESAAKRDEEIFSSLITAAFDSTLAIEALTGLASGSFGQRIKLRDLAYHLRSTSTPVSTLAELVNDFEAGGSDALDNELNELNELK